MILTTQVKLCFQELDQHTHHRSPVILISAAEVNFIKAEIYFRASDATNALLNYNNAITQDLTSLGLAASATTANPLVAYNNTLKKLEQKWITMYQGA
jgi:hypothetical protein